MSHVDLQKSQALIHEDEPIDTLYVVTAGVLRLSKLLEDGRQQVTGFAYPGDFIGLNRHGISNFTAEALVDVSLCSFPHVMLDRLSEDHPGIKTRLIRNADTELSKAYAHMMLLGQKTVLERVITFFHMLGERMGAPVEGEEDTFVQVALAMSRRDIADFLAIRLETLSRTLRQLKEDDLVREIDRRTVIIPDLDALGEMRVMPDL
ncbi:MAG: helix-turn-helix domain-containing protein [Pseudomonadota bacterium]